MRVVLTAGNGGVSHVIPLIPVATLLAGRGHDVSFAVPERLAGAARATGLPTDVLPTAPVHPLPLEDAPANGAGSWLPPTVERARTTVARYLREAVTMEPALTAIGRERSADVIVRETAAWAGWLTGRHLRRPVVLIDYAPMPDRLRQATLGDLLDATARAAGLDPADGRAVGGDLRLLIGPRRWFGERVLSPTTHVLQPPPRSAVPTPDWVAALGANGRPVAYVTFGSMFRPDSALLGAFAAAAATVDVEFVASFGPDVATDQVSGLLPANVHAVAFMPRDVEQALLDRVDLVVCHDGYGALLNAMSRARPVLCIPQHNADGPTRLAQLRWLGSVVVLDEAHRGRDDLAAALHALLTRPTYRTAARAVADELAGQPEFDAAAGLIEQLYDRHAAELRPAASS